MKDLNKIAAILRSTFDDWTGKTCSDKQWKEYLQKDSIKLTLSAMEKAYISGLQEGAGGNKGQGRQW